MTQNRFTLGLSSFLIISLILVYILTPNLFATPYAYAEGSVRINKNKEALINGTVKSPHDDPLTDIPFIVKGYDKHDKLVDISSGKSDKHGKFSVKLKDSILSEFKERKIVIIFNFNGKTKTKTLNLKLDDKTFKKLFLDEPFLPFPPFTVIVY